MPQSLSCVYLHAIFSTKQREPFLTDSALRREVHAYLAEVTKRLDCPAVEVGGYEDHVHLLVRLGRTVTIADWMRETKRVSSAFVKERVPAFSWQSGYGVFGVDSASIGSVTAYIRNQVEHHRKVSFQDEFRRLLAEHSVEWEERYVLGLNRVPSGSLPTMIYATQPLWGWGSGRDPLPRVASHPGLCYVIPSGWGKPGTVSAPRHLSPKGLRITPKVRSSPG